MMDIEEIRNDLTRFVRNYYGNTEVHHLDIPEGEVEFKFSLDETERANVMVFFEDNIALFDDYTEETRSDIMQLEEIYIRFDEDGLYFGKSSYDYTASNAAAYYVLNVYLDAMVEEIPEKMRFYRENYLYN